MLFMSIEKSKLLPGLKLEQYLASVGKTAADYKYSGVYESLEARNFCRSIDDVVAESLAGDVEAVIDYHTEIIPHGDGWFHQRAQGLALTRKK